MTTKTATSYKQEIIDFLVNTTMGIVVCALSPLLIALFFLAAIGEAVQSSYEDFKRRTRKKG